MRVALENRYTLTLEDDPLVYPIIEAGTGVPTVPFATVDALQSKIARFRPIGVFVDIHLANGTRGLEVVPAIKSRWPFAPVIVMTSELAPDVVARALEAGADDFIAKPLNPREISARFQARAQELFSREAKAVLRIGELSLNLVRKTLRYRGEEVRLSPLSAVLFECFFQAGGTVLSKTTLKQRAWPGVIAVADNALEKRIHEMRTCLQEIGSSAEIRNLFRRGYVFVGTSPEAEGK